MGTTFKQAKALLASIIDDDGTTTDKRLGLFLDLAHSDVARARDWPELTRRGFVTLGAPYSDGTVALSENAAALVGTTTLWDSQTPAIDTQYKFASSYQSPWIRVQTITDDTNIVLAENWINDTLSGGSYVLYKDMVSMPSGCNKIYEVWIHDDEIMRELYYLPNPWLNGWNRYPLQSDVPYEYTVLEKTDTGLMQIQVGPFAPDKAYRLEIVYREEVDEGKLGGDTASVTLDDTRLDVILQKALYWAYRRDRARAETQLNIYSAMLEMEWDGADEHGAETIRLTQQQELRYRGYGENYRSLEI